MMFATLYIFKTENEANEKIAAAAHNVSLYAQTMGAIEISSELISIAASEFKSFFCLRLSDPEMYARL